MRCQRGQSSPALQVVIPREVDPEPDHPNCLGISGDPFHAPGAEAEVPMAGEQRERQERYRAEEDRVAANTNRQPNTESEQENPEGSDTDAEGCSNYVEDADRVLRAYTDKDAAEAAQTEAGEAEKRGQAFSPLSIDELLVAQQ